MNSSEDEMVIGYLTGLKTKVYNIPDIYKNCSAAFKHGWISGRDYVFKLPSDKCSVRIARANMILSVDK